MWNILQLWVWCGRSIEYQPRTSWSSFPKTITWMTLKRPSDLDQYTTGSAALNQNNVVAMTVPGTELSKLNDFTLHETNIVIELYSKLFRCWNIWLQFSCLAYIIAKTTKSPLIDKRTSLDCCNCWLSLQGQGGDVWFFFVPWKVSSLNLKNVIKGTCICNTQSCDPWQRATGWVKSWHNYVRQCSREKCSAHWNMTSLQIPMTTVGTIDYSINSWVRRFNFRRNLDSEAICDTKTPNSCTRGAL